MASRFKRSGKTIQVLSLKKKPKSRNNGLLTHTHINKLKYMNRKQINTIISEISDEELITDMDLEIITNDKVYNTLNASSKFIYNQRKNRNETYNLERKIVAVKKIRYNGIEKIFSPNIYFFKSTGTSRNVNTNDIWFPTDKYPLSLGFKKNNDRVTKLENSILMSQIVPNDNNINIDLYGRFLTKENLLISKFLSENLK